MDRKQSALFVKRSGEQLATHVSAPYGAALLGAPSVIMYSRHQARLSINGNIQTHAEDNPPYGQQLKCQVTAATYALLCSRHQ
eukprot:6204120-Pleurochrysis_carterae.AAC.2